jgi:hypothetical protein
MSAASRKISRRERFRSFFDINWFSYRFLFQSSKLLTVISALSFLIGCIGLAINSATSVLVGSLSMLSVLLLVGGLLGLVRTIWTFCKWAFGHATVRLRDDQAVVQKISDLKLSDSYLDSGYELIAPLTIRSVRGISEKIARSRIVDSNIQTKTISLEVNQNAREPIDRSLTTNAYFFDAALRCQYENSINKTRFFNEAKVSLSSDLFISTFTIRIFKSSYFHSFLTNELVTRIIETIGENPEVVYKGSDHFPAYASGKNILLRDLQNSFMNNNIGISTIVFTSDRNLFCGGNLTPRDILSSCSLQPDLDHVTGAIIR